MYYLNSRYYDAKLHRFINADGYVSTGQGLNGYNMFAYCGNNPVMFVDPNGEFWITFLVVTLVVVVAASLSSCDTSEPPDDYVNNESTSDNCYSYAFDLEHAANPGAFSEGTKMYQEKPIYTVDEISDFVMRDMQALGKTVRLVNSPAEKSDDEYIVALKTSSYIVLETGMADYHFAIQLSDGTWADKPGQSPSRWNAINGMSVLWDAAEYRKGNGYYNSETRYFAVRRQE